jgi:hypothetical protein
LGRWGSIESRGEKRGRAAAPIPPAPFGLASAEVGSNGAGGTDELARAKTRIAELERMIGRQQADLHFFR